MPDKKLKPLRIFAISPGDMVAERAHLSTVVDELAPLAKHVGVVLEVVDWQQVVPDMGRPQGVIFDQLEPDSWDLVVGLLWHRFGTPPGASDPKTGKAYRSGTEEEFRTAYRLWQEHGRPRVMFYRCTRQVSLDEIDFEQAVLVKDFFGEFKAAGDHPGIYHQFESTADFERLVRQNLRDYLLNYAEQEEDQVLTRQEAQTFTPTMPDTLPRRQAFFGRDEEMGRVLDALSPEERGWGVVIDGIGGIGKTALAIEAAYRCRDRGLFDAYVFVSAKSNRLDPQGIQELTPAAHTLETFLNETARALGQTGIAKMEEGQKASALLDHLRGTRALLIFDNLETLSKGEQETLANWLRRLPGESKAILTSRRRGGEGALWLRLGKLDWPDALKIIDDQAKNNDRLKAKLQHAGLRRVQQLYDETHGSPLALLHILGLLRVRPTFSVEDALALLRCKEGDADVQKFVFQEARRDLGDNDLAALRALAYFVPSASFEALAEVADLSRQALEMSLERLDALSLVDAPPGEERFSLHPLTRTYAQAELLDDTAIAHATETRFTAYWLAYAQRYGGQGKDDYKTFPRLEAEWPNLNAAAELLWVRAGFAQTSEVNVDLQGFENLGGLEEITLADKDAARQLNTLARALNQYLFFQGRWDEQIQLSERAYALMLALEDWSNAGWRAYQVAFTHYNRAATESAARWTERCNAAWAHGGSKREQALGTHLRGVVAQQRKDYPAAEKHYQDALDTYRDLGQDRDISIVLNDLGELMQAQENYPAAEDYYRQALALAQKLNDSKKKAIYTGNLGELALDRGDWPAARRWCEQALPLAEKVGQQESVAQNKSILARVHETEGRPDLALPLAREALAIEKQLRSAFFSEVQELVARLEAALEEE
jgi:tetratricopeptide (TPR) repeat protein